ncbi:MAG TPA: tetratricopeptide repeat protein, partial [Cyclobacteriaceae bacterium]
MKRIITPFCFFLVIAALGSSNHIIPTDSLKQLLLSMPFDTNRVIILEEWSRKVVTSEPALARQFAEEALTLARKLKFGRGEILALNRLSDYHYRQSNYAKAVDYATQVLRIAHKRGDSLVIADAYRLLGNTNTFGLKQYDQALIYHLKALKILRQQNDQLKIAAEYGSVTWIYAIINKNLDEAHRLADEGIVIAKAFKNDQILSYNYNSKGLLFFKQNKIDSALINLERSINAATKANDLAVIAYNKSILGAIYLYQHKLNKAIDIYDQAREEGERLNLREVLKDAYEGLAKAYEAKKQFDKAYHFQNRHTVLRDSLLNWETTQKTLMIQRGYEEERKGTIIIQLEKEKELVEREKNIYIILFASGFIVLTAIIVLI